MESVQKRIFRISRLIFQKIIGCLSEREQEELEAWRRESADNANTLEQLLDRQKLTGNIRWMEQTDVLHPLEDMHLRIAAVRKQERLLWLRRSVAAAAVVLLAIGGFWFFRPQSVTSPLPEAGQPIVAGMPRAILHLGDGRKINLDTLSQQMEQGGVTVEKTDRRKLAYTLPKDPNTSEREVLFNKIEVPRGGEFDLVLADGTVVWLNADSRLRYPVEFTGKERRVVLEGEAYFQVKKNPDLPFRVEIRKQVVEVLGTEFNVSGYKEDENVYTTLVTGKVKVATADRDLTLLPGEQCVWDSESGSMVKQMVDVEKFVSWKKGKFVLEEQTLEQIMQKFARWYDVAVFYQNPELKHKVFRGSVPRYTELQQVLDILTKTGEVHFNIQNRTVVVYE